MSPPPPLADRAPVRAFVLHWDPATLADKEALVRQAGGEVAGSEAGDGRRAYDAVRRLAPDVVLVWVAWKPSHGRVAAAAIRSASWGRRLPILFVDDAAAPVPPATAQRLKDAVPDAILDGEHRLAFWLDRIARLPPAAQAGKVAP